jgi:hypothetical protein
MSNAPSSLHEQAERFEDRICDQVSDEDLVSWFTNHGKLINDADLYGHSEFIDKHDDGRKYNFFQGLLIVMPISLLLWAGIIIMIMSIF